jgi:hypothetical protein
MKKVFCLLSVIFLVCTSCCNDNDDSSNLADSILVKKVLVTSGDKVIEQKIIYDGYKIVSIIWNGGFRENFTYTGNLITKIEDVDSSGAVLGGTEYNYNNGKIYSSLSYKFFFVHEYLSLVKFVHNEDGTVSYQHYKVNSRTGEEEGKDSFSGKYFFKDGNRIKGESYHNSVFERSTSYEYDTKYNNFKNVLGYNLLLGYMPSINNVVRSKSIQKSGIVSEQVNFYVYNRQGYPTKKIVGVVDGVPFSVVKYGY